MTQRMTRRQLLKLLAAGTLSAALAPKFHARAHYPTTHTRRPASDLNSWVRKGRAIHTVAFYEKPDTQSTRLTTRTRDQSFLIFGEVRAPYSNHNDLWYNTALGYVHSAWVLPIREYPPQPFITDIGDWGFWGEISTIYTFARTAPSVDAAAKYRFYGGTTFHVIDIHEDDEGTGWYKVADDFPPGNTGNHQWVLARDVRRIPRAEMSPLHPFATNKRIEIDLTQQTIVCYESDVPVFSAQTATGLGGEYYSTPTGHHCVLLKQASRHMSNQAYPGGPPVIDPSDIFDLPGVPWNTFFDLSGTAIHGVYWHNDFGLRRSHGCVNVASDTARWVYRWTHPIGGYEDAFIQSTCGVGTPIHIF